MDVMQFNFDFNAFANLNVNVRVRAVVLKLGVATFFRVAKYQLWLPLSS